MVITIDQSGKNILDDTVEEILRDLGEPLEGKHTLNLSDNRLTPEGLKKVVHFMKNHRNLSAGKTTSLFF